MRIGRREALRLLAAAGAGALGAGAGIGRGPLGPRPARAGVGNIAAGAPGCGRVALIFNIGAGYDPALSVIDTLIAYGTPATMFMMGWWVDWTPDTARYIANQGFPVGSHGNLPPELTGRSDDDVKQDIWAAEAAFLRTLGYGPAPYMTAFGGASDARVNDLANRLGYTMIGWDVETGDWDPNVSASMIYDRVMNQVYDGAIVEMHLDASASGWTTAVALPWVIEDLSAQGYAFVTIPQMLQFC